MWHWGSETTASPGRGDAARNHAPTLQQTRQLILGTSTHRGTAVLLSQLVSPFSHSPSHRLI